MSEQHNITLFNTPRTEGSLYLNGQEFIEPTAEQLVEAADNEARETLGEMVVWPPSREVAYREKELLPHTQIGKYGQNIVSMRMAKLARSISLRDETM